MNANAFMTDEEYNVAFANYEALPIAEKVILIRRVCQEIKTYMDSVKTLTTINEIRQFVRLLPIMQQRRERMQILLDEIKASRAT